MTLNVLLNKMFRVHKSRKYNLMQCLKNSTCKLATSTIVKLVKLFKFKLITATMLSHTYCLSDMSIRHRHFIAQNVMVSNLFEF